MNKLSLAGIASAFSLGLLAAAAPAAAQESSYTYGDYWDVADIDVIDGQEEVYMDYLAGQWKTTSEYAKKQGWITGYHVISNLYPRAGEPDLYLVTIYSSIPDAKEEVRREKQFEAFMQKNNRVMASESGARGRMRTLLGSSMLRELKLK